MRGIDRSPCIPAGPAFSSQRPFIESPGASESSTPSPPEDMESLLLGCALGLFAGMVPGPFLTLVATTSLQNGLSAGLKVALIPLGTELPILLASVLVLTQLPDSILQWIGICGGLLILYMAWRVERDARNPALEKDEFESLKGRYLRVALVGLLAPGPWVFWFLIAGPLFLNRWSVSSWHGMVFVSAFFGCFIGMMMLVAWAVATGRKRLSQKWYRRALRGAAVILLLVGFALIWQSWVGNFSALVRPQQQIQDVVGGETSPF